MAATHPTTVRELVQWMREDAKVNRARSGMLSVIAVAIFRLRQFAARNSGPVARTLRVLTLPLLLFARLGLGCEISGSVAAGRRLVLAHGAMGVVITTGTVIGDDVMFGPYVGLGAAYPVPGAPVIGDRVYLGRSVIVVGDLMVGDDAFVGACALVVKDVPPGRLAVGVPAKAIAPAPEQPELQQQLATFAVVPAAQPQSDVPSVVVEPAPARPELGVPVSVGAPATVQS